MWKISKILATMLVVAIGGFIGFVNTNNQNLNANEKVLIRWVDVPMTDVSVPNSINIDLRKDLVSFSGNTENATVNIHKDTVYKPVYIEKKVREIVYEPDIIKSHKLLKHAAPLTLPKINADRKQNQ